MEKMSEVPKDKTPPKLRLIDRPGLKVQFQWEWRDFWVGLFWRTTKIARHFYICILPFIPLHVTVARGKAKEEGDLWCSWCEGWVNPRGHQNDHVQYLRIKPVKDFGGE